MPPDLNARKDMVPPRFGPLICMLIVDTPVDDVEQRLRRQGQEMGTAGLVQSELYSRRIDVQQHTWKFL